MVKIIDVGCGSLDFVEDIQYGEVSICSLPFPKAADRKQIASHIYKIHEEISLGLLNEGYVRLAVPKRGPIEALCRMIASLSGEGQGTKWREPYLKIVYEPIRRRPG